MSTIDLGVHLSTERAACEAVLDELGRLASGSPDDATLRRALDIVDHVIAARRLWLSRVDPRFERPAHGVFPIDRPIRIIREDLDRAHADWTTLAHDPARPSDDAPIAYRSTEGVAWTSRFDEIVTHVHGHSLYHRGQVAMLIARLGGTPPSTDFIVLTRRRG